MLIWISIETQYRRLPLANRGTQEPDNSALDCHDRIRSDEHILLLLIPISMPSSQLFLGAIRRHGGTLHKSCDNKQDSIRLLFYKLLVGLDLLYLARIHGLEYTDESKD